MGDCPAGTFPDMIRIGTGFFFASTVEVIHSPPLGRQSSRKHPTRFPTRPPPNPSRLLPGGAMQNVPVNGLQEPHNCGTRFIRKVQARTCRAKYHNNAAIFDHKWSRGNAGGDTHGCVALPPLSALPRCSPLLTGYLALAEAIIFRRAASSALLQ